MAALPGVFVVLVVMTAASGVAQGAGTAGAAWTPLPDGMGRVMPVKPVGAGKSGFTELGPETTGVGFRNAIDVRRVLENNNFMEGSGVALGDFDGDGWCDIFFCAIDGTNALYRNLGGWRFEDVTARAGVGGAGWNSTGAVMADVNGDGALDLLVSSLGSGVHCLLNRGGGRFEDVTPTCGLAAKTGSLGLALADVEGDGDLDLYVANYGALAILRAGGRADLKQVNGRWVVTGPHADRLRVVDGRLEEVGEPDVLYLNDGRGKFTALPWGSEWFLDEEGRPKEAPWDFGLGVQMRDINGDGHPDIYVCNDFQTVDRLWLNDGRGRFRLAPRLAMRHQSFASMGVDFADIDRDGFLDFFVVEMMSREPERRLRQVNGMAVDFPLPGRFENRPEIGRNTLYWNRGDGTYAEIAPFAGLEASDWSWQPVFLDVDLDGFEDVLVANGNAFDVQDRDALAQVRSLGRQTPEQTRTNLLLYPRFDSPNAAFRNRGDLTFEEVGKTWGFDSRRISHGTGLADLDRDGDLDVVINCFDDRPLVYRNDAAGPRVAVRVRGRAGNVQGIGARVSLLGGAVPRQTQELVSGGRYLAGDDPVRVFAAGPDGPGRRAMAIEVIWRDGSRSAVSNVAADAIYELVEPASPRPARPEPVATNQSPWLAEVSSRLGHVHTDEAFDDYARQPLLPRQFSGLGPSVGWFDLDGDGHDDLFIGVGRGGRPAAFRGDGRGGFVPWMATNAPVLPDDLLGLAGFAAANGQRLLLGGIAAYENPAHKAAVGAWQHLPARGSVSGGPLLDIVPSGASTGPLTVADFDGDGDLDLFVGGRVAPGAYPKRVGSRVFRQESGRMTLDEAASGAFADVGLVSDAVAADLTDDGLPELILACEWGAIRIFENARGVWRDATDAWGLSSWTGLWNSVAVADLDGDGRLDLVAGNWGLNGAERASPAHPLRMFFGDLGGRGTFDLLETELGSDGRSLRPRRSMAVLSQAIPLLPEFYPTHRAFSEATVDELLGRLQLIPSDVRVATLASMAFLNRGGRFASVPLPREAQWSPVFGIATGDWDGDGRIDLALGQNFFGVRPEVARLDAGRGLLLRGMGEGRFEAVAGAQSGLLIYGEQRGVAAADFNGDGRLDLVVAQNGGATRLFENRRGVPGLRVRLKGPVGNPDAVGAVVRVVRLGQNDDGRERLPARVVTAGGGYGSQPGAVMVFPGVRPTDLLDVTWPGGRRTRTGPLGDRLKAFPGEVEIAY